MRQFAGAPRGISESGGSSHAGNRLGSRIAAHARERVSVFGFYGSLYLSPPCNDVAVVCHR